MSTLINRKLLTKALDQLRVPYMSPLETKGISEACTAFTKIPIYAVTASQALWQKPRYFAKPRTERPRSVNWTS